jgi:ribonuclease HI
MTYKLYFDGCCKGNPGPCGIGAVIYKDDTEIWGDSNFLSEHSTNNQSEYNALIFGLKKALELNIYYLDVFGDSLLVINQTNGKFKVSNNGLKYYMKL